MVAWVVVIGRRLTGAARARKSSQLLIYFEDSEIACERPVGFAAYPVVLESFEINGGRPLFSGALGRAAYSSSAASSAVAALFSSLVTRNSAWSSTFRHLSINCMMTTLTIDSKAA